MLRLRYSTVLMFVSCTISALCSGTFDDDYHECTRPCSDELSSKKTCVYRFYVTESQDATSFCNKFEGEDEISTCPNITMGRSFLAINGKSPGPAIQICLGDTIEVLIYNKLGSGELAFHWHGIRQKDSNYMDGVPMITQCPILPFNGFRYKINPENAGTYFYHAHSDQVQWDTHIGGSPVSAMYFHERATSPKRERNEAHSEARIEPQRSDSKVVSVREIKSSMVLGGDRVPLASQQGDGIYGSLTVRGPQDDPSLERIFVLSSRSPTPLTRHARLYPPTPGELLVNGQTREVIVRVKHGLRYLLRLVNANAHDCPILLSVHGHSFRVLAADGNPVQSITGTHVVLFPGERLDAILTAEQKVGKYALDIQGLRDCRNLHHEAYIFYEDAILDSYTIMDTVDSFDEREFEIIESGYDCHRISKSVICSLDLKSTKLSHLKEVDETIYVPFDMNTFAFFTDEMTDNSYNFYISKYYPAYLSLRKDATRIPQINGMSFKYPASPILSQPENVIKQSICSLDERSIECNDTPLFCECLQLIQVPSRETIEIVLIDEGSGGNISHTFHLHGYNVSIMGRESLERPITKDEIMSMDRDGKIHRNLVNPVRKDTFVVPNKGYVILRFYTDNSGYWLWEARSTAIYPPLFGPGMQFLMKVGLQNMPLVPIDFPRCGSNKGMDLIFENI